MVSMDTDGMAALRLFGEEGLPRATFGVTPAGDPVNVEHLHGSSRASLLLVQGWRETAGLTFGPVFRVVWQPSLPRLLAHGFLIGTQRTWKGGVKRRR